VHPDEKASLLRTAGQFADEVIAPRVQQYDADEHIPEDLMERMADLGMFGGVIPVEDGGLGLDFRTFAELVMEVSRVCHVMGSMISLPSALVGSSIHVFGSPEQRSRYLVPLAQGRIFGGAAVTEPGSGSDVASMRTTFKRDGDSFVINGAKAWISMLDYASFFVTFATRDRNLGRKGVTAFIVPKDTPGVSVHPYKNKMGFRPISTGDLVLNQVRLGPEHLLGDIDDGFRVAMTAVERGRLGVASRAVGVTKGCIDASMSYAQGRVVFGNPISTLQIVQSKLTDMLVGHATARLLTLSGADELDSGRRGRQALSMAKMYATDVAARSASDAVQIHGAYGVSPEYAVSRYYRDTKVLQIVEGSNDLHRAMTAEMALGTRSSGDEPRPPN
jgi:alkylation response protein AidB-like acyl-CoA dehydrogenase